MFPGEPVFFRIMVQSATGRLLITTESLAKVTEGLLEKWFPDGICPDRCATYSDVFPACMVSAGFKNKVMGSPVILSEIVSHVHARKTGEKP